MRLFRHPLADSNMTVESTSESDGRAGNERSSSRRRFIRGVAATGGAATLSAFVGGAAAQSETETEAETDRGVDTDSPRPDEQVTVEAALPASAPTPGTSDYTGLFVQTTGYNRDVETAGVRSCQFAASDDDITAYDARLFEGGAGEPNVATTTLYVVTRGTSVQPNMVFVINSQDPCSGDYVAVGLEEAGNAAVETPPTGGGTTGGAIPGFDAVAGVLGVGAAAAAAALRSNGDD